MGRSKSELKSLGAEPLVIGAGGIGSAVIASLKLDYPILLDPERETYRGYGLEKAIWLVQKSATFVIDRDGIIRHLTASFNPQSSMDLKGVLGTLKEIERRA